MLQINQLILPQPMILAPMSGISDLPFRMINRSFGCGMAFMEMINIRSLCGGTKKTQHMLVTNSADRPLGVQLIGHQPEYLPRAIEMLEKSKIKFDLLDFNAACPAPKLALKGAGAGMMKNPASLAASLRLMVKYSPVPVTVKIRTGWDQNSINAVIISRLCLDVGVGAIFIHGRTRVQGYKGEVDYETIRQVKENVDIPVIASGDIWSAADARKMFKQTGCDGIAIARGSLGNPWIFSELSAMFHHRVLPVQPKAEAVIKTILQHASENIRFYGDFIGIRRFRKHLGWYLKLLPGTRSLKTQAFAITSYDELAGFLEKIIR